MRLWDSITRRRNEMRPRVEVQVVDETPEVKRSKAHDSLVQFCVEAIQTAQAEGQFGVEVDLFGKGAKKVGYFGLDRVSTDEAVHILGGSKNLTNPEFQERLKHDVAFYVGPGVNLSWKVPTQGKVGLDQLRNERKERFSVVINPETPFEPSGS